MNILNFSVDRSKLVVILLMTQSYNSPADTEVSGMKITLQEISTSSNRMHMIENRHNMPEETHEYYRITKTQMYMQGCMQSTLH